MKNKTSVPTVKITLLYNLLIAVVYKIYGAHIFNVNQRRTLIPQRSNGVLLIQQPYIQIPLKNLINPRYQPKKHSHILGFYSFTYSRSHKSQVLLFHF